MILVIRFYRLSKILAPIIYLWKEIIRLFYNKLRNLSFVASSPIYENI